jgi:sugar phosphate isomerase/epimerase
MVENLSRRELLAVAGGALAASAATPAPTPKICIFSKHLIWLSVADAANLAAEIGFDGIDLAVRDGGHVEPARAEQDLPAAVEAIHRAGLEVPMITSGIVTARTPHAADVLRTINSLGIRYYRWGGFPLDAQRSIPAQIEEDRGPVRDLAALNESLGVCAMYHTHSGPGVLGASIWDLYLLLKDFDPNWVAANFDVAHATVEGGLGGWRNSASLMAPYMRGIALKDFYWERSAGGVWSPRWCALGEGMVNFAEYFQFLKTFRFSGPIQLHFEYPEMGGADQGKRSISISRAEFARMARRDLERARELMRQTGLTRA